MLFSAAGNAAGEMSSQRPVIISIQHKLMPGLAADEDDTSVGDHGPGIVNGGGRMPDDDSATVAIRAEFGDEKIIAFKGNPHLTYLRSVYRMVRVEDDSNERSNS